MNEFNWVVIRSYVTGEITEFKHYAGVNRGRMMARCGMVYGGKVKGLRYNLFKRKCAKCKISEAADLKKGVV